MISDVLDQVFKKGDFRIA